MLERIAIGIWIFLFWTQVHSLPYLNKFKLGMLILAAVLCATFIRYGALGINKTSKSVALFVFLCAFNLATPIFSSIARNSNLQDLSHPAYLSWVKIIVASAVLPLIFTQSKSKALITWNALGILTAIATLMSLAFLGEISSIDRLHSEYAKFGDANALATVIGAVLPFLILWFQRSSRLVKAFIALLFVFLCSALILSKSRMGLASTLISSGLYFFWTAKGRRSHKLIFSGLLLMVTLGSIHIFDPSFFDRFKSIGDGSSLNRFQSWKVGLFVFSKYPIFGSGVDLTKQFFYEFGYTSSLITYSKELQVHNLWLQLAADLGLVGFFAYSGLVIHSYRTINRSSRRELGFSLASKASFICLVLNSLTIPMLYLEFWTFLIAVLFTLNVDKSNDFV